MSTFPILIAGPSGVGKSTIIKDIRKRFPQIEGYKTTTTREPRPGQDDTYHFVSPAEFQRMIAAGEMLEWAKVHNNYYGAQKQHVQKILDQGKYPIPLNAVDVQGIRAYRRMFPNLLDIFITFESLEELPERIRTTRPNASEEEIATRMASAQEELAAILEYEHVVVNKNGELQETIDKVAGIITAAIQPTAPHKQSGVTGTNTSIA